MTHVEIRRALFGARKVLICGDGPARVIEPGVSAVTAEQIALRWGRIMGCEVVDRSTGPTVLDEAEMAARGNQREKRR